MTNNITIDPVFPKSIGIFQYDESLNEECEFMKTFDQLNSPAGNRTSINKDILDEPAFSKINNFINDSLIKYMEIVYTPSVEIIPYITHSWLNFAKTGEHHNMHYHQNSFISGVFYMKSNPEKHCVGFLDGTNSVIQIPTKNHHMLNSGSRVYSTNPGKLLLFPSTLYHYVPSVPDEEERVSLSFNTFIRGTLGSKKTLDYLQLS